MDIRFALRGDVTALSDLYQQGSAKARLPKVFDGGPPEAVLINLAGGITGADRFQQTVHFDEGTHAVVTTQAAEKIYRASENETPATVSNRLALKADAFGEWLPQETIFFEGGRLQRRLDVDLTPTSRLLACEAMVFGRTAMGETVESGYLDDRWRITIGDRLIFADGMRFDGAIQDRLNRPAIAAGGRALATVLYVGPDSEAMIDTAKTALASFEKSGKRAAASRIGDLIVARFVAADGALLRDMMVSYLSTIRHAAGTAGGELPKLWRC